MKEDSHLIHLWKIIAIAASVSCYMLHNSDITRVILITLVLLCIFTFQFILEQQANKVMVYSHQSAMVMLRINTVLTVCCLFYLFFFECQEMAPLTVVLIYSLLNPVKQPKLYFSIGFLSMCIYLFIFISDAYLLILAGVMGISVFISYSLISKLQTYRIKSDKEHTEIQALKERLKDNEKLMKTIRYAAVLEERNRMAARLHDKIGHNISGSILMLEASMLQMDKNPQKAVEEVNRAVEHLRNGVDDLRHALREERPVKSDLNSNEILLLLNQARNEHNLHTFFKTDGDLEQISSELWQCIHDNVTELLTNVYKHSSATSFTVHIKVMPSMIRVTYTDNGACSGEFHKGLGLDAVEERVVRCNGRCFFEASELGFKVTNVFMITSSHASSANHINR